MCVYNIFLEGTVLQCCGFYPFPCCIMVFVVTYSATTAVFALGV